MTSTPLDDPQDDDPRGLREAVERSNREAQEARQALADLQRKDAFRDAGLDPSNKQHAAIIRGYDGDMDGVKDWVAELGLNSKPEPAAIPDDEQAALNRAAGLSSGDNAPPVSPEADGNARLDAIVAQANRERWGTNRFNEEYTAELKRQNRPVAQMDVVN